MITKASAPRQIKLGIIVHDVGPVRGDWRHPDADRGASGTGARRQPA